MVCVDVGRLCGVCGCEEVVCGVCVDVRRLCGVLIDGDQPLQVQYTVLPSTCLTRSLSCLPQL